MSPSLWRRMRRVGLPALPARLGRFLKKKARLALRRRAFERGGVFVTDAELAEAVRPHTVVEVAGRLGSRPLGAAPADGGGRRRYAAELAARHPAQRERILAEAEDACAHRFDLLGSGPVELGPTIDWCLDFKTGFGWPRGFHADLAAGEAASGADVKVPWELSRCQHFLRLGQAYWLTGDERYAREFSAQLNGWLDANPLMGTINWCNAMEPAIRIANWLWACALFRDSPSFTEGDRVRLLRSALEHGRFIEDNLEFIPGEPRDNHYVADLVGLVYLGVLLPELRPARRWLELALSGLAEEIERQVHPDGVDHESSTGYHRFATELFASAFALCRRNGVLVPEASWRRLEAMLEFVDCYTRPDGCAPIIGDSDDGRLHALTPGPPDDHRHLLALGGHLFARADLLAAAGEMAHEAAWRFGFEEGAASEARAFERGSRAFPEGGFYVMRRGEFYLIAHSGQGRRVTGHGHNDTLSFELAANGRAWIVDSGTYLYTASAEWRNRFRSTAAHNTVRLDSAEINTIDPAALFWMGSEAVTTVNRWTSDADHDLLDAEHSGYERLPGRVRHRRRFYFEKTGGYWLIEDSVTGGGVHRVEAFLHLGEGLRVEERPAGCWLVSADGPEGLLVRLSVDWSHGLSIQEGWVSRRYGVKAPAPVLKLEMEASLPVSWTWLLLPLADRGRIALPELRTIPER